MTLHSRDVEKVKSPSPAKDNSIEATHSAEVVVESGTGFSLSFITVAFIVLAGLGVFGLNYWHSTRCHEAHTKQEIDKMYKTLTTRVLEAESAALASTIELEKFIGALAEELAVVEDKEMHKLKLLARGHAHTTDTDVNSESSRNIFTRSQASEEALARAQLALAGQPSPLKHRFRLDKRYIQDAEVLADRINVIMASVVAEESQAKSSWYDGLGITDLALPPSAATAGGDRVESESGDVSKSNIPRRHDNESPRSKLQDDDFLYVPDPALSRANNVHTNNKEFNNFRRSKDHVDASGSMSGDSSVSSVSKEKCLLWQSKYNVHVGVSWGELPFDLQHEWQTLDCDHLVVIVGGDLATNAADSQGRREEDEEEENVV